MIINHNISALNTHRQLTFNQTNTAKNIEKLSSGLRINRAGDDAAGLAISEKMRGQIRGLDQASRNAQDGISMIQTAEGALNEAHSILQRMKELATQAANGTNTDEDRGELQKEMNQLTSEINRIGNTTEFNTKKLLNGDFSESFVSNAGSTSTTSITKAVTQTITVGDDPIAWSGADKAKFDIKFTGTADNGFDWSKVDDATAASLVITKTAGGGFTVDITATDKSGTPKTLTVDADAVSFDSKNNVYTYNNHGVSFSFTKAQADAWKSGDTVTLDIDKAAKAATNDLTASAYSTNSGTQGITTQTTGAASTLSSIAVNGNSDQLLADVAKVKVEWNNGTSKATVTLLKADGTTAVSKAEFSLAAGDKLSYDANGIKFDLDIAAGATGPFEGTFSLETATTTSTTTVGKVVEDKSATFQIGANAGQSMSVAMSDMRSLALGISSSKSGDTKIVKDSMGNDITAHFTAVKTVTNGTNNTSVEYAVDITSETKATAAIKIFDDAITKVSAERSKLGAVQNRLEHTINNLGTASENLTAAESRIRDVDMAKEMMAQTKNSILAQAAQAMLAQANQQPQGVLQLLR